MGGHAGETERTGGRAGRPGSRDRDGARQGEDIVVQGVILTAYLPKRSVWDLLFNRCDEASQMESLVRPIIGNFPLRSLAHGGILRLMPFTIHVK